MPRQSAGPKLVRRQPSKRQQIGWYIYFRENGRGCYRGTGVPGEQEAPTAALADFLASQYRPTIGPRRAAEILIGEILLQYLTERAPQTAAPERAGYAADALMPFWGDRPLSVVRGVTCRAYLKFREEQGVGPGTVRRELATLSAAASYCHAEGRVDIVPRVTLPPAAPPRDRWLTRSEVARLLRAARAEPSARHLVLFILIGVYTGARSKSILELRWTQNTEGGWVDLEKGQIDFNPVGRRQTSKRRPVISIPSRLLRFLTLAHSRASSDHVLAINGQPVASVKRSFSSAVKRAALENVRIHDLRHTAASWLAQSSINTRKAAAYLGMTEATFERVYAKHDPHRFDEVMEVFK